MTAQQLELPTGGTSHGSAGVRALGLQVPAELHIAQQALENGQCIGANRMQSMEDGSMLYRAENGRPVLLHRTSASIRNRLHEFTERRSVEIGCQIRACPERRREWHMEVLALAIEKAQPQVTGTLDLLDQLMKQSHWRAGRISGACSTWRLNAGLSMDLEDFYRWIREQEQALLTQQIKRWVKEEKPQQKYRAGENITTPSRYGFAVGFITDVLPQYAIYRVRQICKGSPSTVESTEVFFEHATDPPPDPLVRQIRVESDTSFR